MEPYRVFISSIMNRATEDLIPEREAARAGVDHFGPVTTAWAFEAEPASPKALLDFYINGVKSSDLFVLLVGAKMTEPVKAEFETARDHGKPMLVFAKAVPAREPDADLVLHSANVKYDTFVNATELREKMRRSLGAHLLTLIRGDGDQSFGPGDRAAQLRLFARNHTAVRIVPMVPACQYNSFCVKSVDAGVVTLEKDSNRQTLSLPAQRIEDVLAGGPDEAPTLLLNGRLQWITVPEVWRLIEWWCKGQPPASSYSGSATSTEAGGGAAGSSFSYPAFLRFQAEAHSFEEIFSAAPSPVQISLSVDNRPR